MTTLLAYIDPGSGSFLFQATIGVALAAGMSVKVFWRRLKSRFSSERHERS